MSIAVTLAVSPTAPTSGDTVTAVYTVTGNDGNGTVVATVGGDVNIGGIGYQVSTVITLPGSNPLPETFYVPTCAGLTFSPTSDPATFTAVVP